MMAAAVRIIVSEDRADHIDMNFGCPVPKVTRKGGGSALPWKKDLFASIVHAAVDAADGKAWRWEGDRTGRGPAKLVFGVASEAKDAKEEEKKEETTPRREEAKPDPSVAAAKALSTSPAEAKPEAKDAPPSVTRRLKR